jgi:hypothetical protein
VSGRHSRSRHPAEAPQLLEVAPNDLVTRLGRTGSIHGQHERAYRQTDRSTDRQLRTEKRVGLRSPSVHSDADSSPAAPASLLSSCVVRSSPHARFPPSSDHEAEA